MPLHRDEPAVVQESDSKEKSMALLSVLRDAPIDAVRIETLTGTFEFITLLKNRDEKRNALREFVKLIPPTDGFTGILRKALEALMEEMESIAEPKYRKSSILSLAEDMPQKEEFKDLYKKAIDAAIDSADKIEDSSIRRFSLADIAERTKIREGFEDLSVHALTVALGLSEDARYRKYSIEEIVKELPKSCDIEFYRKNTFLGIATALPKKGKTLSLYKKAIEIAIRASTFIQEPYYKKYSLFYIARNLPKTDEFLPLYKDALREALNAALAIREPFARQYALIEVFEELPKTQEFLPFIMETIENGLPFFSARKRIEDIEVIDVIDYVIVAEEKKVNDSKKKRYTREKYAHAFSRELKKLSESLNDIRLLEVLKPYAHIWVRPVILRDTIKAAVERLDALKEIYHGKEIERPLFVKEKYPGFARHAYPKGALKRVRLPGKLTLSIDLGATNTVIMKKNADSVPEPVYLDALSKKYNDTYVIPTYIDVDRGSIGMEAKESACALNIKKLFLEGSPIGAELMEKYLRILYRHIKTALPSTGWLNVLSVMPVDRICVTVPVGFHSYTKALKDIMRKISRGIEVEFVEEPLGAAIGYQIAEKHDKVVMVMDFGGCTLDVMLVRLNMEEVHVISKPDRSTMLGGRDIDLWIAEYLKEKIGIKGDVQTHAPHGFPALILKAEEIKIALSGHKSTEFEWEGKTFKVSRDDFETILAGHHFYSMVDRTISYVVKKAKKLGVTKEMFEAVLVTGGSSLIPSFKEKIAHTFPELSAKNAIYDHSPFSAVSRGAAMYGTTEIIDRHLAVAYALKYAVKRGEKPSFYEIVLEKGEPLPLEKVFRILPAETLGRQREIYLEFAEVPEALIIRKWVSEGGMEFIRQAIRQTAKEDTVEFKGFKIITLPFAREKEDPHITFIVDENGNLKIRHGEESPLDTGLKLQ